MLSNNERMVSLLVSESLYIGPKASLKRILATPKTLVIGAIVTMEGTRDLERCFTVLLIHTIQTGFHSDS